MVDEFLSGLIKTNRSHLFFVDWDKARKYQEQFKDELALLQVLNHQEVDPAAELTRLLKSYPRINVLIPLLLASRIKLKSKKEAASLTVIDEDNITNIQYTFAVEGLSDQDIQQTIQFAQKTGLLDELTNVTNHADYYFGVEVGMDTNARKNRSGTAMEALVEGYVQELVDKYNGVFKKQIKFKKAAELFNVGVPPHEDNKKGDFMIFINSKPINIEVNYFDDTGSKQEIMNSYITRAEDLKKAGWGFALVTDGPGWLKNRRQLEEGYARIKNIYNAKMCKANRLEELVH